MTRPKLFFVERNQSFISVQITCSPNCKSHLYYNYNINKSDYFFVAVFFTILVAFLTGAFSFQVFSFQVSLCSQNSLLDAIHSAKFSELSFLSLQ
jgi:hypothetical protein